MMERAAPRKANRTLEEPRRTRRSDSKTVVGGPDPAQSRSLDCVWRKKRAKLR